MKKILGTISLLLCCAYARRIGTDVNQKNKMIQNQNLKIQKKKILNEISECADQEDKIKNLQKQKKKLTMK
jgi:hypothetical protein